jgi:hypothetical protein
VGYQSVLGTSGHGELELRLPSSRDGAASRFTYSLRGEMRGNMKLKFHPDIGVNFPINRPARKTVVLLWSRHRVNLNLTSHQVAFAFALQLICLAFKQFFCNKKILSLKFRISTKRHLLRLARVAQAFSCN